MQELLGQPMPMSIAADPTGLFLSFSQEILHFELYHEGLQTDCLIFVGFFVNTQHSLCDGEGRKFVKWGVHKKQTMAGGSCWK